mmetsp:Transcript_9132/g.41490  ORF Transcript_9132/g.41490 Transcript_9132/m.41490 type:complete len:252 (+) Transcript_9132:2106-2861(+)
MSTPYTMMTYPPKNQRNAAQNQPRFCLNIDDHRSLDTYTRRLRSMSWTEMVCIASAALASSACFAKFALAFSRMSATLSMAASPAGFPGAAAASSRPAPRRHSRWIRPAPPVLGSGEPSARDGDAGALPWSLPSLWLALSRSFALCLDRGPGSGLSDDESSDSAASLEPAARSRSIASSPRASFRIILDLWPRVPRGRLPSACMVPARARACSHSTAVPGNAIRVAASAAAAAGTWLANTGACGGKSLTQS